MDKTECNVANVKSDSTKNVIQFICQNDVKTTLFIYICSTFISFQEPYSQKNIFYITSALHKMFEFPP